MQKAVNKANVIKLQTIGNQNNTTNNFIILNQQNQGEIDQMNIDNIISKFANNGGSNT